MSESKIVRVSFKAPLQPGDTAEVTVGCRANNPDICKNNGIPDVCAFERADGICKKPSKAWKKQFIALSMEDNHGSK
ncbi:MAG: hypothetical protein IJ608_15005 [Lachnospiraceae bacterium]|nr:hypothetical protein [Lachnospiraceae bacterium]